MEHALVISTETKASALIRSLADKGGSLGQLLLPNVSGAPLNGAPLLMGVETDKKYANTMFFAWLNVRFTFRTLPNLLSNSMNNSIVT